MRTTDNKPTPSNVDDEWRFIGTMVLKNGIHFGDLLSTNKKNTKTRIKKLNGQLITLKTQK